MILTAVLVAVASALLCGFIVAALLNGQRVALNERLRAREADAARLQSELTEAQKARDERALQASQLEVALATERAGAAARIEELNASHARLKAEFAELSAAALRSNREDFLKFAEQSFGQLQATSAGDLAKRQEAIDALVKPLKESLEKVDTKISDLERARASAYGQLGEQLLNLQQAQKDLSIQTSSLSNALSTTRTAGLWGEVQLRRVVELSGLTEHVDFGVQVTAGPDSGRADVVVYLPRGQQIVVDAKAPTAAYRLAAEAKTPAERAQHLQQHASDVRAHVDDLGKREYWAKFTPAPEFVVLFLPGDQFLSAALEADPGIMDRAIDRKVLLATPTTLIALLKAAAYGWRQESVSKNAEEISEIGRELYNRIATFADHLSAVSKSLEAATRSFNKATGSFEDMLLPGARKFVELGAKGSKDLAPPTQVETTPRDLFKRA